MARAAINILGATGAKYDYASMVVGDQVDSYRKSVGVYCVTGSLGMVPFPPADCGWGFTLNQIDLQADVDITFEDGLLTVVATKGGNPYDIKHMITLHILVPDDPESQDGERSV